MDRLELEQSLGIEPVADARKQMDELPPVRLVAVADVWLMTPRGREEELDAFYVGIWEFERDRSEPGVIYRAENFRLRFEIFPGEVIERDTVRPQGIEVLSLADAERKLIELEVEHIRQRSLTPGQESLLVLDPGGNWIEVFESRRVG